MRLTFLFLLFFSNLNATDMRALLFHGNCVTCHFEQRAHSAPSIHEVKEIYKNAFSNKADFVEYMSNWVLKPDAKTSLMSDAIDKYSLMPELGYNLNTLKEINAYIYETDFSKKHEGHKK